MTTPARALEIAASQVGYVEGRGNRTPYGAWYGMDGQPWCAMFTSWVLQHAGLPRNAMTHFAYTPAGYNAYRKAGRWHTAGPQPGDLVFFAFMRASSARPHGISHIGFVEAVEPGGALRTIEGNTDEAGGRTGGKVMRKRRTSGIVGYGRPVYTLPTTHQEDDLTPELKAALADMEARLNRRIDVQTAAAAQSVDHGRNLAQDAKFIREGVREALRALGVEVVNGPPDQLVV